MRASRSEQNRPPLQAETRGWVGWKSWSACGAYCMGHWWSLFEVNPFIFIPRESLLASPWRWRVDRGGNPVPALVEKTGRRQC